MPTTTTFSFGDVVLVPFPFTDQAATKKRPAVVVSSDAYHREGRPDVILMAVTSQPRTPTLVGEAAIAEWQAAGLLRPSVLKPLLATFEKRLVIRRLGRLKEHDLGALRACVEAIIGA